MGAALEFLSQVLSQRGPQAVPYEEGAKWKIREHLAELLKVRLSLDLLCSFLPHCCMVQHPWRSSMPGVMFGVSMQSLSRRIYLHYAAASAPAQPPTGL